MNKNKKEDGKKVFLHSILIYVVILVLFVGGCLVFYHFTDSSRSPVNTPAVQAPSYTDTSYLEPEEQKVQDTLYDGLKFKEMMDLLVSIDAAALELYAESEKNGYRLAEDRIAEWETKTAEFSEGLSELEYHKSYHGLIKEYKNTLFLTKEYIGELKKANITGSKKDTQVAHVKHMDTISNLKFKTKSALDANHIPCEIVQGKLEYTYQEY